MSLRGNRLSWVDWLSDWVFGFDYFVSHTWKDAHPYAEAIVQALEPDLRCFIDSRDFAAGRPWTSQGLRALGRSTVLIVVLSPQVFTSEAVHAEVAYFRGHRPRRRVISIDVGGAYANAASDHRLKLLLPPDLLRIPEDASDLTSGPSPAVLEKIRSDFGSVRQNTWRARIYAVAAVLLLILSMVTIAAGLYARGQRDSARQQEHVATEQRNIARVGEGRFYLERAQESIQGAVGTFPVLPIDAARSIGFRTMAASVPVQASTRFPELLAANSAPEDFRHARHLARYALNAPVLLWSSPAARQHANSIMAMGCLTASELFTLDADGNLRIWNLQTNVVERSIAIDTKVFDSFLSPDRKVLAICGKDGTALLFKTDTWSIWHTYQSPDKHPVAVSLDRNAEHLSIGNGSNIQLQETETGKQLLNLDLPAREDPYVSRLSEDANRLAVEVGGTLVIYDVATRSKLEIGDPPEDCPSLGCQWCGKRNELLSVSKSGRAYTIAADGTRALIEPSQSWGEANKCFVSSTGRFAVTLPTSSSPQGRAMLWDVDRRECLGPLEFQSGTGTIWNACFSDDDRFVYGGSTTGQIFAWRLPERKMVACGVNGAHGGSIRDVAFAPGGSMFASAGQDGVVHVWNASTGKVQWTAKTSAWNSAYRNVEWMENGDELLALDLAGSLLRVRWAATDPVEEVFPLDKELPSAMTSHQASGLVAIGYVGGEIELRRRDDLASVSQRLKITVPMSREQLMLEKGLGVRRIIRALNFSPNASWLACAVYSDQVPTDDKLYVFNTQTGKIEVHQQCDSVGVNAIAFDPVAGVLAAGGEDGFVRFWDCKNAAKTDPLRGESVDGRAITAVAYSIDGLTFAAGTRSGKVRLWDIKTGQATAVLDAHTAAINRVRFSPDGTSILTASEDGTVREWEISSGIVTCPAYVHAVLPGDATRPPIAIVTDYKTTVISVLGQRRSEFGEPRFSPFFSPWSAAYSPRASLLAIGGENLRTDNRVLAPDEPGGRCELWRTTDMTKIASWNAHHRLLKAVAMPPAGDRIATGGADGVALWDPADVTAPKWRTRDIDNVETIAFSPDGNKIAVTSRNILFMLDVQDGKVLQREEVPAMLVLSLAYSPRGDQLALGTRGGGVIVYNLTQGRLGNRAYLPIDGLAECVSFDGDGTHLAAGSDIGIVVLWERGQGMEIAGQMVMKRCRSIAFSSDGGSLLCGSDQQIRRIDIRPIDYLKYFDLVADSDDSALSKDWFFISRGEFLPRTISCCLDRALDFGFVNRRGNTIGELYETGRGINRREELFWRFAGAGNWLGAWKNFDAGIAAERMFLLLGLGSAFPATDESLAQAKTITPISDIEGRAAQTIRLTAKSALP